MKYIYGAVGTALGITFILGLLLWEREANAANHTTSHAYSNHTNFYDMDVKDGDHIYDTVTQANGLTPVFVWEFKDGRYNMIGIGRYSDDYAPPSYDQAPTITWLPEATRGFIGYDATFTVNNTVFNSTGTGTKDTKTAASYLDDTVIALGSIDSALLNTYLGITYAGQNCSYWATNNILVWNTYCKATWDKSEIARKNLFVFNNLSTAEIYDNLRLEGLEKAHSNGWTGKGVEITVYDTQFGEHDQHGFNVRSLVEAVAPGATYSNFEAAGAGTIYLNDIMTVSVYTTAFPNPTQLNNHSTLVTFAASHTNYEETETLGGYTGRGTIAGCSAQNTLTVEVCNSWRIAGVTGNNIIYVGEVEKNADDVWNIPVWSNQAGSQDKNDFIVTVSNPLYNANTDVSDHIDDVSFSAHGNSYAAPRVAGAAALVMHKFDTNAANTKSILLETADDLGAPGVDDVFGHGMLNIGRAMSPVGSLN